MNVIKRFRVWCADWQSWCKKCGKLFDDADIFRNNRKCPNCGAEEWEDA